MIVVTTPPPTPCQELLNIAQKASSGTTWAVGQGYNNKNNPIWYLYCSSKKQFKRLPQTYRGRPIQIFHCPKPRLIE